MNRRIISLLLFSILATLLFGQKMMLNKSIKSTQPRKHPYTNQLIQSMDTSPKIQTKQSNPESFQKLLVILVDFVLEETDDLNTTGNGKFMLEADPTYLYSIGAPPHNREYFEKNLEAMHYYYRAVSAETFQLEFDVFPKDKPAYTLPNPMAYYNPANASSELFVSRVEEYFKTSFETADAEDPEIDFSAYGHYMIIHAGSDWQHDVFQDTPSDIPSFFIKVGSGKEAVVDGGNTLIAHACNVPATISQDFQVSEDDNGEIIHSGYGALNSVLAHEFGHSVGMIDLYNVYSFRPMVGVFDIMDSGGSGILVDQLSGDHLGELVMVEGALPTFPGAFSRNLMFENAYLDKGYIKELHQIQPFDTLNLHTISLSQDAANIVPHTYKIPLNSREYILVENRSVDPDGDGGTAVFGALDSRVILYPTAFDDPDNNPTYEYDYLLPSFQKADGSAVGGGILVWHVNDAIIYDEGEADSDGVWQSNYDRNTVNTDVDRRGVSVIEADGLNDLGSDYSMYWTGTPYDYFHAKKPVLNQSGQFVNWSVTSWRPELSNSTKPPLLDSFGLPSLHALKQISNPLPVMTLQLTSGFFDATTIVGFNTPSLVTANIINSSFSDVDLPVMGSGMINLLSRTDDAWINQMGEFYDSMTTYSYQPQKSDNNADGFYELVTVLDKLVHFVDFSQDGMSTHTITFPSNLITTPLSIDHSVYAATDACLYKVNSFEISSFIEMQGAKKLSANADFVVILGADYLKLLDKPLSSVLSNIMLPEEFGNYEPLIFQNADDASTKIFIMANSGNIYRVQNSLLHKIFTNHSLSAPGQIALTKLGEVSPVLFFGIGNKLHAIKTDGSALKGFPVSTLRSVSSWESPMSLNLGNQDLVFYPIENQGYLAVNEAGAALPEWSLLLSRNAKNDFLYYDDQNSELLWYYPDSFGKLYIHSLAGLSSNPILYSGFRNDGSGVFIGSETNETLLNGNFDAYIYPNPVKGDYYRIHLENAVGKTTMKLYDVSGTLIQKKTIEESLINPRDLELDPQKLGSGVYFLTLESNGRIKKLKFAVEK
ncbi:MAG: T9SS type A sorting domain-containing protein [Candidatus Cloacimonetes bacterium]|nr:T9SS type A sorting domain-containing protein [Candidatus Cloacimonadota bacterium]